MLEPLVDAWEEEVSSDIKMQLLTAAVKLFFKRPPEMQVSYSAFCVKAVLQEKQHVVSVFFVFLP